MSQARSVLALHVALALTAAAVLATLLIVAADGLSFDAPSAAALAQACAAFALPDLSVAAALNLALGSLATAALGQGLRSAVRQLRASHRVVAAVREPRPSRRGLVVFEDSAPHAFCAGLLRPRIYVSTGAQLLLSADELAAVLAHERHHAEVRDPLRIFVMRVVADALFFLPVMRRLAQRYADLAELAADAAAVKRLGAQPLASALLRFGSSEPAVVGIAAERVDHLLGARPPHGLPLALLAWALTALTALAVVALRLDALHEPGATLNVPLFAEQACMWLMAAVPVALGALAVLGLRRAVRSRAD